jgi:hypothetical protein
MLDRFQFNQGGFTMWTSILFFMHPELGWPYGIHSCLVHHLSSPFQYIYLFIFHMLNLQFILQCLQDHLCPTVCFKSSIFVYFFIYENVPTIHKSSLVMISMIWGGKQSFTYACLSFSSLSFMSYFPYGLLCPKDLVSGFP